MIKKLLLAMLLGLVVLAVYIYVYVGGYKDTTIGVQDRPAMILLWKKHLGAYHYIGPVISEVEALAAKRAFVCPQTFGEYLDSPDAVDEDRLRSRGGCVMGAPLDANSVRELPEDLTYETRPGRRYVVARFDGSPAIGPFKVYPKVSEYMQAQRLKSDGAVMEIYTVNGSSVVTEYLFPIPR